jgi:hypothetical protein
VFLPPQSPELRHREKNAGCGGRGCKIFASVTCQLQLAKASAATLQQQEKNDTADVQREE